VRRGEGGDGEARRPGDSALHTRRGRGHDCLAPGSVLVHALALGISGRVPGFTKRSFVLHPYEPQDEACWNDRLDQFPPDLLIESYCFDQILPLFLLFSISNRCML
jgi:hypothetical protein